MKFRIKDGTILEGEPIKELKPTPSKKVATATYELMGDWEDKVEEVLVTDKPVRKVFVNKKFADGSRFGNDCVFIKCIFDSKCEFGSWCQFGSECGFGSGCEFDYGCKFGPNCSFGSDCEFGSGCEFSSGCWFGPECEFGSGCKIDKPYWDEKGKHE